MNTVLLVGAGFSHAISNHVPLTWQLGPAVRPLDSDPRELADIPEIKTGQDLERWLSKIAEPQPYLDERDHALNTARFIQATRQIRNAVAAGQATAMAADMPEWLDALLRFMHIGNHTVPPRSTPSRPSRRWRRTRPAPAGESRPAQGPECTPRRTRRRSRGTRTRCCPRPGGPRTADTLGERNDRQGQ